MRKQRVFTSLRWKSWKGKWGHLSWFVVPSIGLSVLSPTGIGMLVGLPASWPHANALLFRCGFPSRFSPFYSLSLRGFSPVTYSRLLRYERCWKLSKLCMKDLKMKWLTPQKKLIMIFILYWKSCDYFWEKPLTSESSEIRGIFKRGELLWIWKEK